MIKVTINANAIRKTVEVDEATTTVRSFLESNGVDYGRFTPYLAADPITGDMLDKTFLDLGVMDDVFVSTVTKADSAMIRVTINANAIRKTVDVDEATTTVRSFLESNGVDYGRFTPYLAADPITGDMLDKTFLDLGVMDDVFVSTVTKADSAR